jgi:hypothetical protein
MKIGWRNGLGIALSIALLYWAFHAVDFGRVLYHLRNSNLYYFAGATIVGTLIFPVRARRWRPILASVAPGLPLGMLWRSTAIGMMVNNVVPARAGELARAYALTRETSRVSFSAAIASLAVDRVFDAFVVLLLMVSALLDPAFPGQRLVAGRPVEEWMVSGAVLVAIAVFALYLIVFFPERVIRLFELFTRRVAPRLEERGVEALKAFAAGLGVLRHPARFLEVLFWAIVHWLMNGVAFWLAFQAVGIVAPFSAALVVQGLIAIGVAVPSAPGFFGVFEYIGQQGLGLYGVDAARATSWAIGFHVLTYIPITLIGIYYFARLGMHFSDLKRAEDAAGAAEPAPRGAASTGAG